MIPELLFFYLNKEEPSKSCLLTLRAIILKQDVNITETRKYGMPCFCYFKKIFCYLWTDKKTSDPYILMAEGVLLSHPKLKKGNRSRMKILQIKASEDLDIQIIETILQEALNLYTKGIITL
ncbi:DUF1801 domain-containing protein [Flavobacterium sp. 7A]|uniref:DUF1801 domain-containing protein n=1 Tax=Flavobacterium sp. 7A TaxID=2940571 RepID=UPI0022260DA4|nr:DUF1801 domain-containing protein [Flavobacterium sp. 7A]MCW2118420.1 hypothetical protein [Flavobacterium sp. 7A]